MIQGKKMEKELTNDIKLRLRDYFTNVFMLENKSNRYKCVIGIIRVKT